MKETGRFIAHYVISGPLITDFVIDRTDPNQIRYEQHMRSVIADKNRPAPSADIKLGALSELGMPWEYAYPSNGFVNIPQFSRTPKKVELLAAAVLSVKEDLKAQASLWTYAAVEVWLNGQLATSVAEPVYKPMRRQQLELDLKKGRNLLILRMQNLAVRDTRNIMGIEILEHADRIENLLPDSGQTQALLALEHWLSGLTEEDNRLLLPPYPPCPIYLTYEEEKLNREPVDITGTERLEIQPDAAMAVVYGEINGRRLERKIELLRNKRAAYAGRNVISGSGHVHAMFEEVAALGTEASFQPLRFGLFYVLARKSLKKKAGPNDDMHIQEALERIEQREDCSDFLLAGLLRLMAVSSLPDELSDQAERAILNYRYWMTESGSDGMCFWSENHALMFYICAYMAGKRYPDKLFPRSGRTGKQVSEVGAERVRQWLEDIEQYGFEEFLSADYMCVTFGALLNVVDFMDKAESERAARLIDLMLRQFAAHTFRGSIVAPQGRIYRSVILPYTQSAQALIHLLNPNAPYGNSEWISFFISSGYRPPKDLEAIMANPLETEYQTGNAWVKLKKEHAYMLTSVQSPRQDPNPAFWESVSFDENADMDSNLYIKSLNERFHGTTRFEPGVFGYQQHLWYAALDNDTAIFVNHPGEVSDDGGMRPGYWYGNGILPAIRQQGNMLGAIHDIGGHHPIAFTHLFFPKAKLDEVIHDGNWLFGRKNNGYVGIWCSDPMTPHHDRLFHCEYRVYGRRMAYVCQCGSTVEFADFAHFRAYCRDLSPSFRKSDRLLTASNGFALQYVHCENKTQYI